MATPRHPDAGAGLLRALYRLQFLGGAAVATAVIAAGPVLWRQPLARASAHVEPLAPRLAFGPDPRTSAVVSWSTAEPVATPAVLLSSAAAPDGLTRVVAETRVAGSVPTRYHHAFLHGLDPGQTYGYEFEHGGAPTGVSGQLTTGPAAAGPFTFTVFGDQGVSDKAASITAQVGLQNPAFQLVVGDLCYAYNLGLGEYGSVTPAVWDQWLAQVSPVARRAPWMIAVGNHEMEPGYGELGYDGVLARLAVPAGPASPSQVVYAFRYGNVGVVALDANDISYEITHQAGYTGGAQDTWLDATLADLRADPSIDWIVVGFHHCAYCTNALHGSDGAIRDRWQPIFDRHHVDVVVNGHNHSYERSHPMVGGDQTDELLFGGTIDATGTTYLTAGSGGNTRVEVATAPVGTVTVENGLRVPEAATWSAARYTDLSFVAFDVTPPDGAGATTLGIRALRPDGGLIDSVTLRRNRPLLTAATLGLRTQR